MKTVHLAEYNQLAYGGLNTRLHQHSEVAMEAIDLGLLHSGNLKHDTYSRIISEQTKSYRVSCSR
jgi:hypothetical protein